MINETDILLGLINKKSTITPMVGTFVSASATGFIIDVGGGRIPAAPATSYLPQLNEPVWVWFIDGTPYVMGPTTPKPGQGTVVSVAAGLVTLTTIIGTVIIPYTTTITPTAGQVMQIVWQGGGFAIAVMSTVPGSGLTPPVPAPVPTTHVDTFTAVDAGSFGSGTWNTPLVYASNTYLGAWFYGTKISDTIPAAAAISALEVYISARQIYGSAPNFALHPHASKPGGAPSLSSITAIGVTPGWVSLPTAFANALKAGGGSFGIGLSHGGYNIFNSLAGDALSGALRITSTY